MACSHGFKKIILIQVIFLFLINCNYTSKKGIEYPKNIPSLEDSDIICRLGNGYFSNYFREYASKEKVYSHIGIIVIENKIPYVYHSEASELTGIGGVKKEKLIEFLDGIKTYSFYKLNLPEEDKKRIILEANKYLQKSVKFDLELRNDDSELYCTEFVANCINNGSMKKLIQPSLNFRNNLIFSLDDIYKNKIVLPKK